MSWAKFIYFTVMALALLASLRTYDQRRYVLFIPLLTLSLFVELARAYWLDEFPHLEAPLSLYIAIEYTLLTWIISNFIPAGTRRNAIRLSIVVLVPLFLLIQINIAEGNTAYKYLDLLICAPFICLWTILYLFNTATRDEEVEIGKNPMFWISLGNLLYYSGSFFSYGFGNYMEVKGHTGLADVIFWIARVLNIILYIMYTIGFLCLTKSKSYSSR